MQCVQRRYEEDCEERFETEFEKEVLELQELQRNSVEK
jgi:hypothetical protein